MKFGGWARAILASTLIAAGLFAAPGPATAAPVSTQNTVYLEMLWIRCQDTTGEWFSDEIWVDVNGTVAGLFTDFDATETKYFTNQAPFTKVHAMTGDSLTIFVWEKDSSPAPPGDWDFQGYITVNRNLVDTGEHEGYAFDDGEYIVRYRVTSYHP